MFTGSHLPDEGLSGEHGRREQFWAFEIENEGEAGLPLRGVCPFDASRHEPARPMLKVAACTATHDRCARRVAPAVSLAWLGRPTCGRGDGMPRRKEPAPYPSKVGARIRELRLARSMSLADIADASGLSKGHLSSVEHGLAAITVETIERLARGLKLSPMYILAFAKDDERARIVDLILDFPSRELVKLRREIQARRDALLTRPADEGTAPRPR
jgi:transcriptional regulator with XRE-family HTH domain